MRAISVFAVLVGALLLAGGCGKGQDDTVQVGSPGETGPVKRDIDTAKDVAGQASEKVQQGNQEMSGGGQ